MTLFLWSTRKAFVISLAMVQLAQMKLAKANMKHGIENTINSDEYTFLGPNKSVSMPMMIRAGIVNATLRINRVLISDFVKPRLSAMDCNIGARLNQTKNEMKKTIQLR